MKSASKPVLESEKARELPVVQTIAAHSKALNALFCPIVRRMKEVMVNCLKDNVALYMDLSPLEFSKKLDLSFSVTEAGKYPTVEADISKYDKSQGLTALLFECEMMKYFGVDQRIIEIWKTCHQNTELRSMFTQMKMKIRYQRKSGDAMTFLGNTMFNMAVCAQSLNFENVRFSVFAGDDSVFWGHDVVRTNQVSFFESKYNLSVKILTYSSVYFCSKFLAPVDGHWVFYPDPIKMICKLGRYDVVCSRQLEEYRCSLLDLLRGIQSVAVWRLISECVAERYYMRIAPHLAIAALWRILNDKKQFSKLFVLAEGANEQKDPTYKVLA